MKTTENGSPVPVVDETNKFDILCPRGRDGRRENVRNPDLAQQGILKNVIKKIEKISIP